MATAHIMSSQKQEKSQTRYIFWRHCKYNYINTRQHEQYEFIASEFSKRFENAHYTGCIRHSQKDHRCDTTE
jgi:hypothetical protein